MYTFCSTFFCITVQQRRSFTTEGSGVGETMSDPSTPHLGKQSSFRRATVLSFKKLSLEFCMRKCSNFPN